MIAPPPLDLSPVQQWMLASDADEFFIGSERGASKSFALVLLFMRRIQTLERYQCVLFRRRFTELRDTLIPLIEQVAQILGPEDFTITRGTDPRVTCKRTGSEIALSAAEGESDAMRYQGANKHALGVDEPQNIASEILSIISAVIRAPEGTYRPQFYYCANPLGIGHAWLKQRFVDPARKLTLLGNVHWGQESWVHPLTGELIPLEKHWKFQVPIEIGGEIIYRTREVVLAGTRMNPVLNYRRYHAQMRETLSETRWRAWGENDWDVMAGQFYPELADWITPSAGVSDYDLIIGSIDPGFRKTAVVWLAVSTDGRYKAVDDMGFMDSAVADIVPHLLTRHPDWNDRTIWILDPAAEASQTSGRSTRQLYGDYGLHAVTKTHRGARSHGWNLLRSYGRDGRLKIAKQCGYTLNSLEQLVTDERKASGGRVTEVQDAEKNHGSEDRLDGDHWADALRYALEFAALRGYDEPTQEQMAMQRAWQNPLVRTALLRSLK